MAKIMTGKISQQRKRIGIVVSRFNDFITKRLLKSCLLELERSGVKKSQLTVLWVPGSLEIPVAAQKLAKKKNIDAVIALGAVIRGETLHFELVSYGAVHGITSVSIATEKPVIFGILSTDTVKQAYKRSEPKGDNKGKDAARAALEMINVLKKIK
ncbi:MAG: 6,7-dimethyl-8-ribityllumazine synthase [Omnitrophica WOR_2 bacterium RIFCSPHIGHO2_01_FULL_48_9]|nr:MAG: 6,7-dimethyl-8-ribityllumazine synthase [Omnitrophica WOR_2 bacterium RIFCSPHIGHO2_02_FULL_48_11]OGX30827.1 MAG: 6,7-dimethyl-8-ribityllumazine synthase [Omnitrophica WOR_2 bacterium RIFCSPHIGHO2_01_FULL_48_9]